jgi:hypothetical protein
MISRITYIYIYIYIYTQRTTERQERENVKVKEFNMRLTFDNRLEARRVFIAIRGKQSIRITLSAPSKNGQYPLMKMFLCY